MKKELAALLAILLITFAIRVESLSHVYKADPQRVMREDSASYEEPARGLLKYGRFVTFSMVEENGSSYRIIYSRSTRVEPELIRTPGYPLFIAAIYCLTNVDHYAVIFAQILVSLGTIALVFLLGKLFWDFRVALLATVLFALDPVSFLYSQQVLTETLFAFFFVAGLYCGARWILRYRSLWMALLMSLCFVAATFVRPVTYYMVVPLVIGFVWLEHRGKLNNSALRTPHSALILLGVILIPWIVLVGGWQLRNYRLTGRSEFSFIQSYNMLWYRGAGIVALQDGITIEEARQFISISLPNMKNLTLAQQHALYQHEGLALMMQHPILCLRTQITGAAAMLFGPGGAAMNQFFDVKTKGVRLALLAWQAGYLALIYGGLLIGSILCILRRREKISGKDAAATNQAAYLFIWGVVVYLIVVSAGPEAYSRFRAPLSPVFALFAARGFFVLPMWSAAACRRFRQRGLPRDHSDYSL